MPAVPQEDILELVKPTATVVVFESALNDTRVNPVASLVGNGAVVHKANFVWNEDWTAAEYGGMHGRLPITALNNNHYIELSPLVPFGMMLIVSSIIFILILFRRWPGLVAGIVAGCLTSISIYLLLLSLKQQKLVYE